MRKISFIRFKNLILAASARFYTHNFVAAMPKHRLEPRSRPEPPAPTSVDDLWLFSADDAFETAVSALAKDMNGLSHSLEGLRETLRVIDALSPITEATPQTPPNAVTHHDATLFEGEPLAEHIPQDTVLADNTDFLFETSADGEKQIQKAA